MHIHILGICGTFMGSVAVLARELGHRVTGSDANVYPPMSTQLEEQGIQLLEGYRAEHLHPRPDRVIIGNALSRGNEAVEAVLNEGIDYVSGPQWLYEQVLKHKTVLAVAGTHGKTTTSTMLAWVLDQAGLAPGFLIGGVPQDFPFSARMGDSDFFVIEADEYDSAFFDKRSKFVHYHPHTLILNNLEYDHADIFPDLEAIKKQFHHLVRTVPARGKLIFPVTDDNIQQVLEAGCWSEREAFAVGPVDAKADWHAELTHADGSVFKVYRKDESGHWNSEGEVNWSQTGLHNVSNGLAVIAAASHVGVTPGQAIAALSAFGGIKRRMELLAVVNQVSVYDDFAHHPTAIKTTLAGLRAKVGRHRIIAVIEPRSNTMRLGHHKEELAASIADADLAVWFEPGNMDWSLQAVLSSGQVASTVCPDIEAVLAAVVDQVRAGDHIVIMSNGGFGGIHQKLIKALDFVDDYE
jgi:UDP-N-acetylmuramate: L-alanyl-gamma-D-glutamyl-meso-diaminopimelate ligase